MPMLPDTKQIERLGRELAALDPRERGPLIEHTVRLCRARLESDRGHPRQSEASLRALIRAIRLSIEQQAPHAQIGPPCGI